VRTSYEVTLRGLRFHTRVGVLPHERDLPQPVEFDVTAWPRPPRRRPAEGILLDYRTLYDVIAAVLAEGPTDYLEGLVASIAERIMAGGQVRRVRVVARKPHVVLPGPLDHAEVAIDVSRDA
jgi:7,8-dihydroneopterin aldolase/epimerase/oxygenase